MAATFIDDRRSHATHFQTTNISFKSCLTTTQRLKSLLHLLDRAFKPLQEVCNVVYAAGASNSSLAPLECEIQFPTAQREYSVDAGLSPGYAFMALTKSTSSLHSVSSILTE